MSGFRIIKNVLGISLLFAIPAIGCLVSSSLFKASPQAMKTTVADIFANPDKYDGKMVQVAGLVSSLQFNASRVGPYTTFNLDNPSGKGLSLVSLGILPIKEGDFVGVTVRYNKTDRLWIYSIEGLGNR